MSHKYTSFTANEFSVIGRLVSVSANKEKVYIKVATTEKYEDKNKEWQDKDEFHHLTVFNKKIGDKVLGWNPGDIVQVKGRLKPWQDREGDDVQSGVVLKVKEAKCIARKQA